LRSIDGINILLARDIADHENTKGTKIHEKYKGFLRASFVISWLNDYRLKAADSARD
jgi:hypothetical protein